MLHNHLDYEAAPLKAGLIQRHGSVLGTIVFDAVESCRRAENARDTELRTELTVLHANISALSEAAGERRAKSRARLDVAYAAYLCLCDEDAKADSVDQAQIAPMTARSLTIQGEMRNISQPRINERDLLALASLALTSSELPHNLDKEMPPPNASLSKLAKLNLFANSQKPRS
jgi:hypothetical protein